MTTVDPDNITHPTVASNIEELWFVLLTTIYFDCLKNQHKTYAIVARKIVLFISNIKQSRNPRN